MDNYQDDIWGGGMNICYIIYKRGRTIHILYIYMCKKCYQINNRGDGLILWDMRTDGQTDMLAFYIRWISRNVVHNWHPIPNERRWQFMSWIMVIWLQIWFKLRTKSFCTNSHGKICMQVCGNFCLKSQE